MKLDHQETDRFLAVRYPHIKNARILLEKFDRIFEVFESINGCNIEIISRAALGDTQWNDITIHWRELTRNEVRAKP